ncbi:MAG: flagellar basal body-associated FliL family protein [Paracoccaceae bacterium]
MKKLLIPLVLALIGLGGGLFAGNAMKPHEPAEPEEAGASHAEAKPQEPEPVHAVSSSTEYVKLDRQFVVPVVNDEKVEALMVISMAVEIDAGGVDNVFEQEPKLRDEFLRVLFTHAQSGGFSGVFTEPRVMDDLRAALAATARSVLGSHVRSVLLTNVIRQDL